MFEKCIKVLNGLWACGEIEVSVSQEYKLDIQSLLQFLADLEKVERLIEDKNVIDFQFARSGTRKGFVFGFSPIGKGWKQFHGSSFPDALHKAIEYLEKENEKNEHNNKV